MYRVTVPCWLLLFLGGVWIMINALISGRLVKDPVRKIGQSGKPFCNFVLAVNQHNEETTVLVSGICFGDVAEKVSRLKKGDPLTVVGQVAITEWQGKDGVHKVGLNITVSNALSPYEVSKRRGTTSAQKQNPSPHDYSGGYNDDFDDEIPI
jgi:single-stranded DNA-binding protein